MRLPRWRRMGCGPAAWAIALRLTLFTGGRSGRSRRRFVLSAPAGRAGFRYFSALRVPKERMRSMKNRLVAGSLRALLPVVRLFATVFPGQSNCFAFAVTKVRELHPWMVDEGTVDAEWVGQRYAVGGLVAGEGTARRVILRATTPIRKPRSNGSNGMGDVECLGILRYAQDDSKNIQQQHEQWPHACCMHIRRGAVSRGPGRGGASSFSGCGGRTFLRSSRMRSKSAWPLRLRQAGFLVNQG